MSTERLRHAAALMRERAEAAQSGAWEVSREDRGLMPEWGIYSTDAGHDFALVEDEDSAAHIASWHPAVALAVADWLEATAARMDLKHNHGWRGSRQALAVARAYLGETNAIPRTRDHREGTTA